jgi:hypothetical protein
MLKIDRQKQLFTRLETPSLAAASISERYDLQEYICNSPAQGRGWAVVEGDELHGMIFFHGGDDSEFVAKKRTSGKKTKR